MDLLKRSIVNNELAIQRKNQIDEGIALAHRVDGLRQSVGSLEQQQAEFLSKKEDELRGRLVPIQNQISVLEKDIKELEEKRALLMIPLDEEWAKVEQRKSELTELESKLISSEKQLREKTEKLDILNKKGKATLARINVRERELIKVYDKASQNVSDTENAKKVTFNEKEKFDNYLNEKNHELLMREASIAVRERELEISTEKIREDNEEIIRTKAQLADQRGTLERAMARLKK